MSERTLFPLGSVPLILPEKQAAVVALLTTEPAGMRALDIGIALHEADGCQYCRPNAACKYAHTNATSILKALRKKGLTIHRKTGLWQLTRPPVTGHDPATAPFPTGF